MRHVSVESEAGHTAVLGFQVRNFKVELGDWRHQSDERPSVNPERTVRFTVGALWVLMLIGFMTVLTGCVDHYRVAFEPDLLKTSPYSGNQKLHGKVLVLTESKDDERVTSVAPTGFFGALTRWDIPLGIIIGESATSAFNQVFTEGADWHNFPASFGNYAAVVRPQVLSFSYRYDETWSGPVETVMETTVLVFVLDNSGTVIWERRYQSGPFNGEPFEPPIVDARQVSPAIHRKIHELMVRASLDFAGTALTIRQMLPQVDSGDSDITPPIRELMEH
jgi:hypothetical protein